MARHRAAAIALAAGALVLAAGPASAETTQPTATAATDTITVPDDFVRTLSDTRATGHYALQGTGLRLWTGGTTSTDKVAEYVAAGIPLADAGEPALQFTNTTNGGVPGAQLVVDFDADGTADGILVGESLYGNDWWLNNGAKQFVKDAAPSHTSGSGSDNHGTLDQWRAAFPSAQVTAFGFSLGSGVKGDGVLDAIDFAGVRHTFAAPVVLTSKEQCKKGGWATSTRPVFADQGTCVSSFTGTKRPVPAI
ncbi:hypothetical protein GCU67_01615 [Modestobacter muralis]|uniref:VCBS repeat-containing protein n=1 Tax=Modestobacter muralis TaxID=1608614 RepID=A0A6P0EMU9_9ACTN|nr:hypothetical protein [Modestobacter muralis]NEK92872.1 hypothetical protein [Modestobacter muralis]NEN49639.1 hypothetical protein [Modestobacter muralis]